MVGCPDSVILFLIDGMSILACFPEKNTTRPGGVALALRLPRTAGSQYLDSQNRLYIQVSCNSIFGTMH